MKTISCGAPYGLGGLGRHLEQLVEGARADGSLFRYYAAGEIDAGDFAARAVGSRLGQALSAYTPLRFNPGGRAWVGAELFDRAVARDLEPVEATVGFSGQALHTFERARELGCARLELVSPTCHVDHVVARHDAAYRLHPIEKPWLSERQRRKCTLEYELADAIHVTSGYAAESFAARGLAAKVQHHALRVSDRFTPGTRGEDGLFRIVYVGALTVAKGVPVLLDAFRGLDDPDLRLTLVGGWATRGMRRHLAASTAADPRISIAPGDPLPQLRRSDVYVHPSWHDGFALAAREAMACGLPVVVTEDTGMKESVEGGVDGWIVPTGDAEAIAERLAALKAASSRPAALAR
jgi:glycosyltransferase involved in cell wall biosynthesis